MSQAGIAPFRDSREHLAAELEWLDHALWLLLHLYHHSNDDTGGHGWFLSRKEVEACLSLSPSAGAEETQGLREALRDYRAKLLARKNESLKQRIYLSLPSLVHLFGLSPVEELGLLVGVAPDLDGKYSRVYAYLQDDLTRRLPSLDLILKLSRLNGSTVAETPLFSPNAPLFRWRLATVANETEVFTHRLMQGVLVDQRIVAFLLEIPQLDAKVVPFVRRLASGNTVVLYPETAAQLAGALRSARRRTVGYFYGPAAPDGASLAEAVCRELGIRLLHLDLAELLQVSFSGGLSFPEGLVRFFRDALLESTAVYFTGFDKLMEEPRAAGSIRVLEELLAEGPWLMFLEGRHLWAPPALSSDIVFLPFLLPTPDYPERRDRWVKLLENTPSVIGPEELHSLAAQYRLTFREMEKTLRLAGHHAALRGPESAVLRIDDLIWAGRALSEATFGGLTRTITPRLTWDDLILPEDVLRQLREICTHVRQRATVLHDWGFDRRFSLGKGLYVLFVGSSGTGKTLAAEVIAGSLGRELLKVDLSTVVSKYIGETEKNLQRIFEGAEGSDAIVFFDEADALFGKRSEVKDSHDRYANIEINFLLQRLEEFEGVVILASNFAQNIDEAFRRRIHLTVEFPFPDEAARLQIWRSHFPQKTPISEDLNLEFLAKHFQIPGGNIRNIVFNAAFLAAEDAGRVSMHHLLQAARREYRKMGKLYREEDFVIPVSPERSS